MFDADTISRLNSLNPTLHQFFMEGLAQKPMIKDRLFNVQQSSGSTEHFQGVGDMPIEAFEQFKRDGTIGQSRVGDGFASVFTHESYPLDIPYDYDDVMDMNEMKMRMETEKAAIGLRQFMESKAAAVFNNAFSSSHTGSDDKALCASDHPFSPNNLSNTWDNSGTTAISPEAIKDTRVEMQKWRSETGLPIEVDPDIILVPPDLYDEALEYTKSQMKPGVDTNDINTLYGGFEVISWKYLTDADNWFMIGSEMARQNLLWMQREEVLLRPKPQDSNLVTIKYEMKTRFSLGWLGSRFIYGHNV